MYSCDLGHFLSELFAGSPDFQTAKLFHYKQSDLHGACGN